MRGDNILVNIIYASISIYIVYNYLRDPKRFKLAVLPLLISSYLEIEGYMSKLDQRLKILIYIIVIMTTVYYVNEYYREFKYQRLLEKRRLRELEEKDI